MSSDVGSREPEHADFVTAFDPDTGLAIFEEGVEPDWYDEIDEADRARGFRDQKAGLIYQAHAHLADPIAAQAATAACIRDATGVSEDVARAEARAYCAGLNAVEAFLGDGPRHPGFRQAPTWVRRYRPARPSGRRPIRAVSPIARIRTRFRAARRRRDGVAASKRAPRGPDDGPVGPLTERDYLLAAAHFANHFGTGNSLQADALRKLETDFRHRVRLLDDRGER